MTSLSETGTPPDGKVSSQNIGFFLTPEFSPIGFFCAVEVLRTANRYLGRYEYSWQVFSLNGEPVKSANGIPVVCDGAPNTENDMDYLFVCSGFHPEHRCDVKLLSWLRKVDRHGTQVGAITTGTYILAKAGLVSDRRCTIHGENAASLLEQFPDINLVDSIFEIDRKLFTCAGGTSAIDMFVQLVSMQHGEQFATALAHQFQQDRVRNSQDHQSKFRQMALRAKSSKLACAIKLMEENIQYPLSIKELATGTGITSRQLQRLFRKHTNHAPNDFYLRLRLYQGRLLLLQTDMPVAEISLAAGFSTHAHFTRCYGQQFGYSPKQERRQAW